jgi:hypothetical protein
MGSCSKDESVKDARKGYSMNDKEWTKEQLVNFLRKETMFSDARCRETASILHKDGRLSLLMRSEPSDYTVRKE